MTDVYQTPEKASRKGRLFQIAVQALEEKGWKVERIERAGKASVRRITRKDKGKEESKVVSIRTTQDGWIAFPRAKGDRSWVTLSDVDAVVAVSVDDKHNPQFAQVHMISGNEARDRFDRGYAARMEKGYRIPVGRGMWVSLYEKEDLSAPLLVGAGAGLSNPMIARVPLAADDLDDVLDQTEEVIEAAGAEQDDEAPLTIPEAKRRLALTLGIEPAQVKITIVDN